MTENEIDLIKTSFDALKPFATEVVDFFYNDLFSYHPEARGLFNDSKMPVQKKALINSLVFIVDHIEKPDKLKSYLVNLGGRHNKYGVEPVHYTWAANSLITTLAYFFDNTWSGELELAWKTALGAIAGFMIEGQKQAEEEQIISKPPAVEQINSVIRELIKNACEEVLNDKDVLKLAKDKARILLQQALDHELSELKQRPTITKKAS